MDSHGNKVNVSPRSEHLYPDNRVLYQHSHNACPSPVLTTENGWSRPLSNTSVVSESRNNESKDSIKTIKTELLDIGSRTTVHGIANIVTSQSVYKKLLWVAAFLACLGLLIWQLVDIFVLHTSYQTTTSFGLKYNTEFPQITLCNNGYASYGAPVYHYTVKHMIVSCEYARLNEVCETPSSYWSNKYGTCFTIKPPDYLAKFSGVQGGVTLVVNLEKDRQRSNDQHGMRITVHDKNIFPFPFEDGLTVEGGDEAFIGIRMVHTERLGKKYGECLNNKKTLHDKVYTLKACELLCWERILMGECNCTDPEIDSILRRIETVTVDKCYMNDEEPTLCLREAKRKFMDKESPCNSCHLPCSENHYTIELNRHYWLRGPDVGALAEKTCKNNYNVSSLDCPFHFYNGENYVKIIIYSQAHTHESIEEEPLYDTAQLLADIGGSLGLFIGASVLSLGEVIEVVYVCVHGFFQRRQQQRGTSMQ